MKKFDLYTVCLLSIVAITGLSLLSGGQGALAQFIDTCVFFMSSFILAFRLIFGGK